MTILEFINKYIVVINSIILVILVFRYLQDLRRYQLDYKKLHLEHEKLKYELEKLRNETQTNQRLVVEASQEQLDKYVIGPVSGEIKRAAEQLRESVESLHRDQLHSYQLAQAPQKDRSELTEISSCLRNILTIMNEVNMKLSRQPEVKLRVSVDEDG